MRRRRFKMQSQEMRAAIRAASDAGMSVRVLKMDNLHGTVSLELSPRQDAVSEPTPEEHAKEAAQIDKHVAEFVAKNRRKSGHLTAKPGFGKSHSTGSIPTRPNADTVKDNPK